MACFVPYCKTGNNSQKKPAGVHEHRFPPKTSPALRQKWLDQINRVLTRPLSDRDYVCTLHFDPNDIVPDDENYDKRGRKRKKKFLKHLAYPKLQLGRPPPVIKERPKNKNQSPPMPMPNDSLPGNEFHTLSNDNIPTNEIESFEASTSQNNDGMAMIDTNDSTVTESDHDIDISHDEPPAKLTRLEDKSDEKYVTQEIQTEIANLWIPTPQKSPKNEAKKKYSSKTKRNLFGTYQKWISPRKIKVMSSKKKRRKRKTKKLQLATKKNNERISKNKQLKELLKAQGEKLKAKTDEAEILKSQVDAFRKIFNEDQIRKIQDPKKKIRWLPNTIQLALEMYVKLGTKGYNDLREKIPAYPDLSTLRRHIQGLDCSPGVLHDILKLLNLKVKKMTPQEKECGIFIDEIALNAKGEYDQSKGGQKIGWATVAPSEKSKKKTIVEPNPSEVDLNSLIPKDMNRKKLVETLQKLGLDSKGKIGELKARLIGHIASEKAIAEENSVDLKSLQPMNMKVKELKEILGKLGLETIGARPDLRLRLKAYIISNTKDTPDSNNETEDEAFEEICNSPGHVNFFDKDSDSDEPSITNDIRPSKRKRESSESSDDTGMFLYLVKSFENKNYLFEML